MDVRLRPSHLLFFSILSGERFFSPLLTPVIVGLLFVSMFILGLFKSPVI